MMYCPIISVSCCAKPNHACVLFSGKPESRLYEPEDYTSASKSNDGDNAGTSDFADRLRFDVLPRHHQGLIVLH